MMMEERRAIRGGRRAGPKWPTLVHDDVAVERETAMSLLPPVGEGAGAADRRRCFTNRGARLKSFLS